MKVSNQLMLALALTFGVSLTANAKRPSLNALKKTFKVEHCDCVAQHDGVPTFLSDLRGDVSVSAQGRSLAEAENRANRQCSVEFKPFAKAQAASASIAGCRKKVNVAGFGRWKEI